MDAIIVITDGQSEDYPLLMSKGPAPFELTAAAAAMPPDPQEMRRVKVEVRFLGPLLQISVITTILAVHADQVVLRTSMLDDPSSQLKDVAIAGTSKLVEQIDQVGYLRQMADRITNHRLLLLDMTLATPAPGKVFNLELESALALLRQTTCGARGNAVRRANAFARRSSMARSSSFNSMTRTVLMSMRTTSLSKRRQPSKPSSSLASGQRPAAAGNLKTPTAKDLREMPAVMGAFPTAKLPTRGGSVALHLRNTPKIVDTPAPTTRSASSAVD